MAQDKYSDKNSTEQQQKLDRKKRHEQKKLSVKSNKHKHQQLNAEISSSVSAATFGDNNEVTLPKWNDFMDIDSTYSKNKIIVKKLIKVVVIGESGAGKTNLIQRLTQDRFNPRSETTIGIDFATYDFIEPPELRNKSHNKSGDSQFVYKAQIWDTAGQER